MNTSLLTIFIVFALIVGTVTVKKSCKTGHHAWCVPESTWHHAKARAPVWFKGPVGIAISDTETCRWSRA